jgi:hypothetical protein
MTLDQIGHIGYLFLFLGLIAISYKKRGGWALRFTGEAMWVYLGLKLAMTSIWLWGLVFLLVDMFGYVKWRKHD